MEYREKLLALKGIGPSKADKIVEMYPTEEALVAALAQDVPELSGLKTLWAEAYILPEAENVASVPPQPPEAKDETVEDAEKAPEAAADEVAAPAEPETKSEAPAAVEAVTEVEKVVVEAPKTVTLQNLSNQPLKVSYHKKGRPDAVRIGPRGVAKDVDASVLQSKHFQDLVDQDVVKVLS